MRKCKTTRVLLLLCLLTAFAVLLFGCGNAEESADQAGNESAGTTEGPVTGGTLTVGMGADLTKLDLHTSTVLSDRIPLLHVQEMLVTIDENMKIIPMLASNWDMSDDGKTVTFELREGVLFHNPSLQQ